MRAKNWAIGIIAMVGMLLFVLGAIAGGLIPAADKGKENSKAAEHSPVIEQVTDHLIISPSGLSRIVFIHYRKDFAKPPWAGGGKKENETTCYEFFGKGVKWRNLPVSYVIDPDNLDGLSESDVTDAILSGAEVWDDETGQELFSNTYVIDYNASWDSAVPDGRNELLFGDYPEAGVIAVTVVWGYFSGPPGQRRIIEFDILFDTDFEWGDATGPLLNVMDVQNIATHEIGHGAGLGDLYVTACSDETMYGYSEYGETDKRTLNSGDIEGIQDLYGG